MITKTDRRRVPLSLLAYRFILLMTVAVPLLPDVVKMRCKPKYETCVEDLTAPPSSTKRIPQFAPSGAWEIVPYSFGFQPADGGAVQEAARYDSCKENRRPGSGRVIDLFTSNSVLPPKWGGL